MWHVDLAERKAAWLVIIIQQKRGECQEKCQRSESCEEECCVLSVGDDVDGNFVHTSDLEPCAAETHQALLSLCSFQEDRLSLQFQGS